MARASDGSIEIETAQLAAQRLAKLAAISKDALTQVQALQAKVDKLQAENDSKNVTIERQTRELIQLRTQLLAYRVKEGDKPASPMGFSVRDFEPVKVEVLINHV